ncbi:MAG: DNA polymerase III subunit delta [Bacteroidales bacterium]|nr:DNA polymerase III subunit delta [Bacteroidales bacterium]
MKFNDIIGQKSIISNLVRSVKEERVSHAQIFAGPEGTGKLSIAIAFAQYISCENRSDNDSCGVCPSCAKFEKLIHPDLHFVFPVFKKGKAGEVISSHFIHKWREIVTESPYFNLNRWLKKIDVENEQGLIYAAEANEIIKILALKTYESDYKTMIIWLPEKMHHATANKLLKMIEEPPDKTLFLLVSEEPELILPTIMSRCQFIRVPLINTEDLTTAISVKFDLPGPKAKGIANSANGNFLKAVSFIIEDESRSANLKRFIDLMRLSWKRDIPAISGWSEEIAVTGREAQKQFLTFSLEQLRENYMLNIGMAAKNLVFMSDEEAEFAGKFNSFINKKNIAPLTDQFSKAHIHISANGNAKIIFLDLAVNIVKLIR